MIYQENGHFHCRHVHISYQEKKSTQVFNNINDGFIPVREVEQVFKRATDTNRVSAKLSQFVMHVLKYLDTMIQSGHPIQSNERCSMGA